MFEFFPASLCLCALVPCATGASAMLKAASWFDTAPCEAVVTREWGTTDAGNSPTQTFAATAGAAGLPKQGGILDDPVVND
jgi:hypothetical protein